MSGSVDGLNRRLLVERFGTPSRPPAPVHRPPGPAPEVDDSELTTARRRRRLDGIVLATEDDVREVEAL